MTSRRLIRIKVLHLLYVFGKHEGMTILEAEKELIRSISKSADLYYHVFLMITEIQRKAFLKIDAARNRLLASPEDLNPNTRFIDNPVIRCIASNRLFNARVKHHLASFADCPELVTHLYNRLVASGCYARYMELPSPSREDHRAIVLAMISEIIAPDEEFTTAIEEKSIFWNDDLELVLGLVYKTVRFLDERGSENDWIFSEVYEEDDLEFAKNLFRKSLLHAGENIQLVDKYTENWDIERVPDVDKIILNMAITELQHCTTIPVRVTFDEYIEIAKCYCPTRSAGFINGVLDKVFAELKAQDKIEKTGRGLLEI